MRSGRHSFDQNRDELIVLMGEQKPYRAIDIAYLHSRTCIHHQANSFYSCQLIFSTLYGLFTTFVFSSFVCHNVSYRVTPKKKSLF